MIFGSNKVDLSHSAHDSEVGVTLEIIKVSHRIDVEYISRY
jgi:hypothetical protein